jgi:hypothetical protein
MTRTTLVIVCVAAAAAMAVGVWATREPARAQDPPRPAVAKWAYKLVRIDNREPVEGDFTKLGEDGWELCTSTYVAQMPQRTGKQPGFYFIKRAKR